MLRYPINFFNLLKTSNLISGLALALMPMSLLGQKYSNEFLSIGIGARAQALGSAVVAQVDDVTAGVWNPAGLAASSAPRGLELGAMHAEWFAGVGNFDYLALSLPTKNPRRRVAISAIRFGIDQIPNTLTLYESDGSVNFANVSEFSAADYAFIGSFAQRSSERNDRYWTFGGNFKVIHRRIGAFANSWGFGLDAGVQYRSGPWQFGAVLRDLTSTFNAWTFNFTEAERSTLQLTGNAVPINSLELTRPQIALGIAYRWQGKKWGISPELDLIATTDGRRNTLVSSDPISLDPALGVEISLQQTAFFRLGVNQFQRETNFGGNEIWSPRPSIGVGLKIATARIDYAFTDLAADNNTFSHIISVQLAFRQKNR